MGGISVAGGSVIVNNFNLDNLTYLENRDLCNKVFNFDGGLIEYFISTDFIVDLSIQQTGVENIQLTDSFQTNRKFYVKEQGVYSLLLNSLQQQPNLGPTEYYYINYQLGNIFNAQKIFGNNLGSLPAGFQLFNNAFGRTYFSIQKINVGTTLSPNPVNVTYINNTSEQLGYRLETSYNGQIPQYSSSNFEVFSNSWNGFNVYAFANLTNVAVPIFMEFWDNNTNSLLNTITLNAGQNYQNQYIWGTNYISDLRIEFRY